MKPAVGFTLPSAGVTPAPSDKKRCGTPSLLEVFRWKNRFVLRCSYPKAAAASDTSPVPSRERRPDASRPVGEGSGRQETSEVGCRPSFLLPASSRDPSLCHPERSEGSRASARACMAGAGHRSVRRGSSPQRLRMTQKNIGASCASRSMPKNLTPNPFPRAKGNNRRGKNQVGF